jgi:hypothetical protein
MKNSKAYLVNGAAMVVTWLVARIIMFMYLFYHMFVHYDQVHDGLFEFGIYIDHSYHSSNSEAYLFVDRSSRWTPSVTF